mmetsp:Transcript_11141/g.15629  ORF Transcript_11141/g.15629 Transcript_11141/m.15629 type:complete len:102 (-) Transcript_11141:965-1270(-)
MPTVAAGIGSLVGLSIHGPRLEIINAFRRAPVPMGAMRGNPMEGHTEATKPESGQQVSGLTSSRAKAGTMRISKRHVHRLAITQGVEVALACRAMAPEGSK